MSLETQLTRVMRSNDDEKLLVEFKNGFMLGFEKNGEKIIQEPLEWFGGLITPSKFSNDMASFARSRPSESELCWQRLEMRMVAAYKEILASLKIQEYERRDVGLVVKSLLNLMLLENGEVGRLKKTVKDLRDSVYSFVFAPECRYKIASPNILKTKPSSDRVAIHTGGKISKYFENFSRIQIVFPNGHYVFIHNPCSKSEYFFADKTNEDWYSKAFCYLSVKQELHKEFEHCVDEKHKLMNGWRDFKAEFDKTDFSNLLQGLGFTKNSYS